MKCIKVFIVDDHSVVRFGIRAVLQNEPDLCLCGEAIDIAGAKAALSGLDPDIILVDISLEDESGIDLIHYLSSTKPDLPVLVFSMHDELVYIQHAMQAGAKGYFHKNDTIKKLPEAIRKIQTGQSYFSDHISHQIVRLLASDNREEDPLRNLSQREKDVFRCLGLGKRRLQIADELCISEKTVSSHVENIKTKLNLSSSDAVTQYAIDCRCKKWI